jgi:ABC-type polysaccharide/polyol phosphate transport system ATPase subunit
LILVSHNLGDIRRLCDHACWIDHGNMVAQGEVNEICDRYEREA